MRVKIAVLSLFVFFTSVINGQSCNVAKAKNKFLDRTFWKSKPTIATIDKLIKEGNSLTEKNRHSMDPMSYAIIMDAGFEVQKYLLDKGLNISERTHDKRTYLFWAVYKNNMSLVDLLIKRGAETDIIDSTGFNLIQFAAVTGNRNIAMYERLIKLGQDITSVDKKGRNVALLYARNLKENLALLNYFEKKGVNLKHVDNSKNTLFTYACKSKDKNVLAALIKKGIPYKTLKGASENAFTMASGYSHGKKSKKVTVALFNYLEGLGFNPKFSNKRGNTALHNVAFSSKDITVFKYLIEKGLDVNKKNKRGNTVFANASMINSKEVLDVLKVNLKDINTKNNKGETALTLATRRNKPEIVTYLIENGSNIAIRDSKSNDLYYHLVDSFRGTKMTDFDKKCDIFEAKGLKIKESKGLMNLAIKKSKLKLLDKFIAKSIDINAKDKDGYTAIQTAIMVSKDSRLIKILLEKGAKKLKTPEGETLYDLASENELLNKKEIEFLR